MQLLFSDFTSISIEEVVYLENLLYINKYLDDLDIKTLLKESQIQACYRYGFDLLNKKMISKNELISLLLKKFKNTSLVNDTVKKLEDNDILNEHKTIDNLLFSYQNKCYGKYKIINLLKQKKFDKEMISQLLFPDENEINKANKLYHNIQKRYLKFEEPKRTEMIYKYLYQKGFDNYVIEKVLRNKNESF